MKDEVLEEDGKDDPRFTATAEELKEQGITDFQLHYALQTIGRLGPDGLKVAMNKAARKTGKKTVVAKN